jgi:hypothetical protein
MTISHGSKELNQWAEQAHRECIKLGYHPTIFTRMRHEYGTQGAIKKLLISGNIETGLQRILDMGRPDLSIEYAALKLFPEEFTEAERACAKFKLDLAKKR